MRKDFGSKPMLYPMPVLIIGTYGEDGTPNAMNAAWGGIVDTNLIGICLADHKTTRNIFARKAFTVSMADAENMVAADYVGSRLYSKRRPEPLKTSDGRISALSTRSWSIYRRIINSRYRPATSRTG